MKDAALFPIYGSAILLSLYILFKYINKDLLTYLFSAYFSIAGIFTTVSILHYYLSDTALFKSFKDKVVVDKKLNINLVVYKEEIHLACTQLDLINVILSLPIAIAYGLTRYWLLNNFYGIMFSVIGI